MSNVPTKYRHVIIEMCVNAKSARMLKDKFAGTNLTLSILNT